MVFIEVVSYIHIMYFDHIHRPPFHPCSLTPLSSILFPGNLLVLASLSLDILAVVLNSHIPLILKPGNYVSDKHSKR